MIIGSVKNRSQFIYSNLFKIRSTEFFSAFWKALIFDSYLTKEVGNEKIVDDSIQIIRFEVPQSI